MVGGIVVFDISPRQHVVVFHLEVATVVVEALAGIPVVAGIDIQTAVKHIGCGISHIVTREKILWFHIILFFVMSL